VLNKPIIHIQPLPLAPVTDDSSTAMGTVLQQRVQDVCQTLAFFSRKLSPAQQKYSDYDRELLAIYEAVRYFPHMLEAQHFTIMTNHKPLSFAVHKKTTSAHYASSIFWISTPSSPRTSATFLAKTTLSRTHFHR